MAIGYGAQGRFSNSSIEPRRQFNIDILAMTIEITEDVMVKAGITDKIRHKGVWVEGIVGGPGGGVGGGGGDTKCARAYGGEG